MRLPTGTTREIPLAELSDDRTYQYRESSYTGSLKETIIENDLVHPIVVLERENGDGREFQIVDGFRRVMAAKALGREKIKARIFSELSDEQIKRLKGISNLAVEDMDAVERFRFVKGCVQAGMTQEKNRRLLFAPTSSSGEIHALGER
ncbi:MAG: ParB N-terminal domain-containing protein [Deltaproteobacteria bacterium]|nr:ParB N-terminal domain-containing protein [Deltaproteobacteria bacterium]